MALKLATTYKGLQVPHCYIRVETPTVMPDKTMVSFVLQRYSEQGGQFLDDRSMSCPYDLNGGNIFEQVYAGLKATPEYAGADDVFEPGQA